MFPPAHICRSSLDTRTRKVSNMEFDLGENIFLYARTFRRKRLIHVRQYNRTKNGRKHPTKTGISMTPNHFESLVFRLQEINDAYEHVSKTEGEYRMLHIGGGLHLSMSYGVNCVELVRFNMVDNGDLVVSKCCISLPISVWKSLGEHASTLSENEKKHGSLSNEPTSGVPDCASSKNLPYVETPTAPRKKMRRQKLTMSSNESTAEEPDVATTRKQSDAVDIMSPETEKKRRKLCFSAEV